MWPWCSGERISWTYILPVISAAVLESLGQAHLRTDLPLEQTNAPLLFLIKCHPLFFDCKLGLITLLITLAGLVWLTIGLSSRSETSDRHLAGVASQQRFHPLSLCWALSVWVFPVLAGVRTLSGGKLRCDFSPLLNVPSTPSFSLSSDRAAAFN